MKRRYQKRLWMENPETHAWQRVTSMEDPTFVELLEIATKMRWSDSTLLRMVRAYQRSGEQCGRLELGT